MRVGLVGVSGGVAGVSEGLAGESEGDGHHNHNAHSKHPNNLMTMMNQDDPVQLSLQCHSVQSRVLPFLIQCRALIVRGASPTHR